ncbi:MAG: PepSY-associated TM helix domain-containing protein [Sphingobium limneticum]
MKNGIRQSMSWLHGWSGLLLGWLLFAVFLTGTIAYFRQEITLWMQPELHGSVPSPRAAETALAKLAEVAPNASSWTVNLPNDRSDTVRISWRNERDRQNLRSREGSSAERRNTNGRANGGSASTVRSKDPAAVRDPERRDVAQAGQGRRGDGNAGRSGGSEDAAKGEPTRQRGGGRGRDRNSLTLDATTGEVLKPRETAGGNFLYRFHFELYALPRDWARWIVGIATMAMFVAIISGIITHKKIFKDFFTFRPSKGQRSWLDAHNAVAVLSLPFHIMITYSGLLLFTSTLLPWAGQAVFGDNPRAAFSQMRQAEEVAREKVRDEIAKDGDGPMTPIQPLLDRSKRIWGQPASRIAVSDPGKAGSIIEILPTRNDSLVQQSGSGGLGSVKLGFNAKTGEQVTLPGGRDQSVVGTIDTALGSLHRARFAEPGLRWLFFLAGVGGTVMVGTGLVLWSVKRAEKSKVDRLPFGHRLVDHLNVGAVAGLIVAVGAYFWSNRLLPVGIGDRADWEIYSFFIIWLATFLHPLLRPLKKAWIEQLVVGGLLFAAIPLLNAATVQSHLGVTIPAGNWLIAGFDLVCLLFGMALLHTAVRVVRYKRRSRGAAPRRVEGSPALAAVPAE